MYVSMPYRCAILLASSSMNTVSAIAGMPAVRPQRSADLVVADDRQVDLEAERGADGPARCARLTRARSLASESPIA